MARGFFCFLLMQNSKRFRQFFAHIKVILAKRTFWAFGFSSRMLTGPLVSRRVAMASPSDSRSKQAMTSPSDSGGDRRYVTQRGPRTMASPKQKATPSPCFQDGGRRGGSCQGHPRAQDSVCELPSQRVKRVGQQTFDFGLGDPITSATNPRLPAHLAAYQSTFRGPLRLKRPSGSSVCNV